MPDADTNQTTLPPLSLGGRPWAISRTVLPRVIEAQNGIRGAGEMLRPAAHQVATPRAARRSSSQRAGGAVAVLPLTGVLTPRGSFFSFLYGGAAGGLMEFRDAFRDALRSPDVGAIVLDIDSPGGLVDLVPETAAEIRDARGSKPIVAVANTLAASGAYWIAAQADEIIVTPSGEVGSVGVYVLHDDFSGRNEQLGIVPTYIHAGEYKVEGNPDEPLGDDARAAIQQDVDDLYAMFVEDVAAGRDTTVEQVQADYGKGRTINATRAVTAGMADRVDTLEAVIGGLLTPGANGRAAALAGRVAHRSRAEVPATTPPVENDPTHVPETAPDLDPPADPVVPDTGPDADPEPPADPVEPDVGPDADIDVDENAAIAALLI